MFVLVRMQLHNHVDAQLVKRYRGLGLWFPTAAAQGAIYNTHAAC